MSEGGRTARAARITLLAATAAFSAVATATAPAVAPPSGQSGREADERRPAGLAGNASLTGEATCLAVPARTRDFGSIELDDWREWVDSVRYTIGSDALAVVLEDDGRTALRQRYVPAGNGTRRVVMAADLPEARTYRLVQSIQLESGWDWGGERHQGGKIGFGLSGGRSTSGGSRNAAGFSARLGWRGNRDGTARLVVYSYAADRPGRYGEDLVIGQYSVPVGQWFDVTMELTTNSSTSVSDGSVRVWIDGELMLDRDSIGWQTAGGVPRIDNLYYSSFYGGSSAAWSPDGTTYARVADPCWAPVIDGYSGL